MVKYEKFGKYLYFTIHSKVGHMHGILTSQIFRPLWCYRKPKKVVNFNILNLSELVLVHKKKVER